MGILQISTVILAVTSSALGLSLQRRSNSITNGQSCVTKTSNEYVPGAGIDKFTAFDNIYKDGFSRVACVKDFLYYYGDKFGDNKHDYDLASTAGVSIVNYDDHVAKEDREPMDTTVCFDFCRTIPNMGFFGLVNGRSCYCTPYYKAVLSSANEQCDATCPGEPTSMCGGKSKSSVFEMHMCADTRANLAEAIKAGQKAVVGIAKSNAAALTVAGDLQATGIELKTVFGLVGDNIASNMMQDAMGFARDIKDAAKFAKRANEALEEALDKAVTESKRKKLDIVQSEAAIAGVRSAMRESAPKHEALDKLVDLSRSVRGEKKKALDQYLPVPKDSASAKAPSTCGGEVVNKPLNVGSAGECATACDTLMTGCTGFQYFGAKKQVCVLFSKIKTVRSYTGCKTAAPFKATCYTKFADDSASAAETFKANRCYSANKDAAAAGAKQAKADYAAAKTALAKAKKVGR